MGEIMIYKYKCVPEFYDSLGRPYFQAMYKNKFLEGYYFHLKDGEVEFLSSRRGSLSPMNTNVSGKSKYPKVCVVTDENGTRKTIHLHQIVAQTFHAYPIPDGVSEEDWKRTPKSVKSHFDSHYWEANHIDHNHLNFHPSNLEWVSRGLNVEKYHEHRLESED